MPINLTYQHHNYRKTFIFEKKELIFHDKCLDHFTTPKNIHLPNKNDNYLTLTES